MSGRRQRAARCGRRERHVKVLTVYADQNPRSFCHGVLERFTAGLADAGHESDVVDLYAIKFDPVFRDRDVASYTSGDVPMDILELMDLEQQVLTSCRGPVQRFLAARAMRGKSKSEIAAMIRNHMPKDVLAQQEKVAGADALAFIAPVHFCSFPSILKGWIDRVFTLDFAFGLTSEGWRGDINGRIPLLHHRRALIMTSTIFNERAVRRRRPRRHRPSHRRLGISLSRHRTGRPRLLLRRHHSTPRDHPGVPRARLRARQDVRHDRHGHLPDRPIASTVVSLAAGTGRWESWRR